MRRINSAGTSKAGQNCSLCRISLNLRRFGASRYRDGKIAVLIVGVGGFLGMGEKDVAVPFNAVQFKTKDNNKWYPVMNTTKDALRNAPGDKYDHTAITWMPENVPATTGTPATPSPRPKAR
jgi:hypothetical protein